MSDTRQADLDQLRTAYQQDRQNRTHIEEAAQHIVKESGKIRSMREALVKAHRDGKPENVKDIHEYIKNKPDYQNQS